MLVIDTSIAVKWVIAPSGNDLEEDSGEALALLPHGLIAPDLMLTEFANALWKKVRRNEIDRDQATESLKIFPTLVNFLPSRKFANDALRLSLELDHPVYDCVFLAVAELNRLQLVSADRKFVNRCAENGKSAFVTYLGDFANGDR